MFTVSGEAQFDNFFLDIDPDTIFQAFFGGQGGFSFQNMGGGGGGGFPGGFQFQFG